MFSIFFICQVDFSLQLLLQWLPLLFIASAAKRKQEANGLYGSPVKYFLEQTMSMDREAVKSPYNLPLERVWPFIWTNLNPLHQWLLSAKFGWNWTSGSGVVNVFSLLSPLEDGCGPSFAQTWIPNTKGCLVPRMVEIWSVDLEKKIFKMSTMYFHYYLPSEYGSVVLEKKMKMWKVYRQTDEQTNKRQSEKLNWAFIHLIKFVNVFSLFPYYLPLERGVALHLNKLEFPSPKDALYQVSFELALWFLRRRFF